MVRTIDVRRRIQRFYQRHYINVDGEKLDRWLVSLGPAGVDQRFGARFRGFREAGDHVEIG